QYLSGGLPVSQGWIPLKAKGEYLFCRILRVGEGYLGVWSFADTLVSALNAPDISQIDYVVFSTEDGEILDGSPIFYERGQSETIQGEEYLTLEGQRFIVSRIRTSSGPFFLMALTDEQTVLEGFTSLYNIIIVLAACLVLMMAVAISVMQSSILAPLKSLVDAMNNIRRGDFSAQIEIENSGEEFRLVNDTFNAMIREIKRLKVDIYEEKLLRQKTRQQYYQLQIQPHFFMNSLNMIYQFAQIKNFELVQKLAMHLSAYFRYSLKNEAELVSLKDELAHVENYLDIQKIRYPYNLKTTVEVEPEMEEIQIPPLIIQTFIENAIKYAVNMDAVTEIGLKAEKVEGYVRRYLKISIYDDGPGFSREVLGALENGQRIFDSTREHVGIFNVQQRLWLIYQGNGDITFRNREPHGALVEVVIPIENKQEEEL
ncbi:MAG: histidine kinase, partial [Oscillospiraceae bacterium]|nr:histidine kinase [Oscillospiraceae bacterium]